MHDWLKDENTCQEEIEYLQGQKCFTDYLAEQGYVTDAITDDALSFLTEVDEKENKEPFCLYVGYTAPHSPWLHNHPKEYTDLYKDCAFLSNPQEERHPDSIFLTDEVAENTRDNLIGYYAAVTAMDANIGRIMDKIEQMGIQENTLIIFSSDNGFTCGQHGFWGKGNGTFPSNLYDTSVKVPFIISHPGVIQEGSQCDALVSAYDFMPTLLDYVWIPNWRQQEGTQISLPGRSFCKALFSEDFTEDEAVVVLDEYGPNRMIRSKDYKYIKRYPYGPDEFYDLVKDPEERQNQILNSIYQDEVTHMKRELEEWFFQYVNPEIDGAKERVFGSGQIQLAGIWAKGEESHSCDDYIKESKYYKRIL